MMWIIIQSNNAVNFLQSAILAQTAQHRPRNVVEQTQNGLATRK